MRKSKKVCMITTKMQESSNHKKNMKVKLLMRMQTKIARTMKMKISRRLQVIRKKNKVLLRQMKEIIALISKRRSQILAIMIMRRKKARVLPLNQKVVILIRKRKINHQKSKSNQSKLLSIANRTTYCICEK